MVELVEVTTGLAAPEGPVALDDGSVLVVETLAGRVTRITPDGAHETVCELGGGPNGLALGPEGRCYVCNNGGLTVDDMNWLRSSEPEDYSRQVPPFAGRIEVVDVDSRATEVLYQKAGGEQLVAPNDLVFDHTGSFWFTDFGSLYHRGPQPGWVCYASIDGRRADRLIGTLERPNGIGLSPDERQLYVAETMSGRVWSFDLIGPGELAEGQGRVLVDTPSLSYDSLAVEAGGTVSVAAPSGNHIARVDPSDGSIKTVPTPYNGPTNICFGGSDLRIAYITLHGGGALLRGRWPAPGLPLAFRR
jgi:gluconolactonase